MAYQRDIVEVKLPVSKAKEESSVADVKGKDNRAPTGESSLHGVRLSRENILLCNVTIIMHITHDLPRNGVRGCMVPSLSLFTTTV